MLTLKTIFINVNQLLQTHFLSSNKRVKLTTYIIDNSITLFLMNNQLGNFVGIPISSFGKLSTKHCH
jgi:hypothetical protein